ncbi:MAG: hypothetical protein AAFY56_11060 [Pseudomonadota bacterium]
MITAEGTPEALFQAFYEDNRVKEPILFLLLANRLKIANHFVKMIEDVLHFDAILSDKIAFCVSSSGLSDSGYVFEDSRRRELILFPVHMPAKSKPTRGDVWLSTVSDEFSDRSVDEIENAAKKHLRFSADCCEFLRIDPSKLPVAVVAVRGISEPIQFRLPTDISLKEIEALLTGLSKEVSTIDRRATMSETDILHVSHLLRDIDEIDMRIYKLRREGNKQIQRPFYRRSGMVAVMDAAIMQMENGRFNLEEFVRKQSSTNDVEWMLKDQNIQKAERIAGEIAEQLERRAWLEDQNKDLKENLINVFRSSEDASKEFRNSVQTLVSEISASRRYFKTTVRFVGAIDKASRLIANIARAMRFAGGSP